MGPSPECIFGDSTHKRLPRASMNQNRGLATPKWNPINTTLQPYRPTGKASNLIVSKSSVAFKEKLLNKTEPYASRNMCQKHDARSLSMTTCSQERLYPTTVETCLEHTRVHLRPHRVGRQACEAQMELGGRVWAMAVMTESQQRLPSSLGKTNERARARHASRKTTNHGSTSNNPTLPNGDKSEDATRSIKEGTQSDKKSGEASPRASQDTAET